MNVLVYISSIGLGQGIIVGIQVVTSTGVLFGADVPMNFAASSTQMNQAALDRARALLIEQGVPGAASATYKLFGGAV